MKELLQARIAQVRTGKLFGSITEENFSYFVDGANYALRFYGLEYDSDKHSVIQSKGYTGNYNTDNIESLGVMEINHFKRGYLLVKEVAEKTDGVAQLQEQEAKILINV